MFKLARAVVMVLVLGILALPAMAQDDGETKTFVGMSGVTIEIPAEYAVNENPENQLVMIPLSAMTHSLIMYVGEEQVGSQLDLNVLRSEGAGSALAAFIETLVGPGIIATAEDPVIPDIPGVDAVIRKLDLFGLPVTLATAVLADGTPVYIYAQVTAVEPVDLTDTLTAIITSIRFGDAPVQKIVTVPDYECPTPEQPDGMVLLCNGVQFALADGITLDTSSGPVENSAVLSAGTGSFVLLVSIELNDGLSAAFFKDTLVGMMVAGMLEDGQSLDDLLIVLDDTPGRRVELFDGTQFEDSGGLVFHMIDLENSRFVYFQSAVFGGDAADLVSKLTEMALSVNFRPEVTVSEGAAATEPDGGEGDNEGTVPEVATIVTGDALPISCANNSNVLSFPGSEPRALVVTCPAGCSASGSVWGTDIYTNDSTVCTAAAHAGLISLAEGGSFVITLQPGEDSYPGSERNGVTTSSYGNWNGSYILTPLE